jgi:hypothetical protein
MKTGSDRFIIDFNKTYTPFPVQAAFHASPAPMRFLGGAAGPGKTACLIVDHMIATQQFNVDDARHVHTLLLRRTQPQLEATVLTRFHELIPKELYKSFNLTKSVCTWLNGSSTKFGSMQYEHDAWSYQGQWLKVGYDELCEFTFAQWNATSAWNRCPVSKWTTKDGAGNPIGIGAGWVRRVFVDHVPCDEMDSDQRRLYNSQDYAYFPCTYLDNPIFANDPQFIARLMTYPKAIREALMNGSWDVVGGYFYGAFDAAENVCDPSEAMPSPWHRRWISGDWGFEHDAALYWHYMDDYGVLRTYKEVLVKHHDPEMLAEMIVKESTDPDGRIPRFEAFPFSHDAFADQTTKSYGASSNSVARRMGPFLLAAGLPGPLNSGKDKLGREQTMYNLLRRRVPCGTLSNGMPKMLPNWIISKDCPRLIECIGTAPRDTKKVEQIASYLGDDPLQGAGYGVYHVFGQPAEKPNSVLKQELWAQAPERSTHSKVMEQRVFDVKHGQRKPMRGRTSWAR